MIRFGYACKVLGVPGSAMRACTLKHASPANLLEISRHNLAALQAMVNYSKAKQIALLRISSDIIPLASHPGIHFDWQQLCGPELEMLGKSIRGEGVGLNPNPNAAAKIQDNWVGNNLVNSQNNDLTNIQNSPLSKSTLKNYPFSLRVSMHPGQYTVLNSPHPEVVERAIADLVFHAQFLDALGVDTTSKIILHVGGVYGEREAALKRFKTAFERLPAEVMRRLVLENDERSYAIDEVVELCTSLNVPAVFDVFHHSILAPKEGNALHWLQKSANTWKKQDGRQKIHYSQQLAGGKVGSHSLFIAAEPFLEFYSQIEPLELDIMLEVKDKNLSAQKCQNLCTKNLLRRALTDEWARYKYTVLEKSPSHYQQFRDYLKADKPDGPGFYRLLEQALSCEITPGAALNAAQHIWGYLDEQASPTEKRKILGKLQDLKQSLAPLASLKKQLYALANAQKQTYLLQSLYFYDF